MGLVLLLSNLGRAAIDPNINSLHRYQAGSVKKGKYISEGFFAGGSAAVTSFSLKDVRRGKTSDGERIVFDIQSNAENANLVPYFEVKPALNEGRVILSIWSNGAYEFKKEQIKQAFAKSPNVKMLNILPRVEEGLTIVEMVLNSEVVNKKKVKLESFYLTKPNRIIIDIL